ncbi:red chlorophyll catabolite reductase, chloroplastic [Coffea eugenioides]|uniref:red chlorophyll catabolite reductase, chloroplastic n=1 Tax=Coffea eugenioides TaxID=49369 RepID=UPI000F60E4DA|nr:red chlorophyll catabolite reductase, chloroplastic [Coffea eugenioides]
MAMAVHICTNFLHSTHTVPSSLRPYPANPSSTTVVRTRISCLSSSSSSPRMDPQTKFMEFPHVSAPIRDLMLGLVSSVETHLGSSLLPCSLPPDVQYYQNPNGNAEGTVFVRSAIPSSPVDFILGSWINCKLPSGGALNIASLSTYLKPSTNAPNFLIEVIQSTPTSLVLILDMPPRKDLVLYPEYLKTFYEDTELDRHRQLLEKLPEVTPYSSPSLYIRALISPTAILVRIEAEAGEITRIDEIIRDNLSPIANEMIEVWLSLCASVDKEVGEAEMAYLEKRDLITKTKTIEIDLGTNIPRLFGQEIADRVLGVLRGVFNV